MERNTTNTVKFPPIMRWILWGALSMAIVVYLVVLQTASSGSAGGTDSPGLKNILYLLGLILVGLGQGVKYFANHLRTPEGKPKVPVWIDQAFIVSLAVTEASAIFGLMLGFTGALPKEYLPLFILAAVGMILLNPKSFYRVEEVDP